MWVFVNHVFLQWVWIIFEVFYDLLALIMGYFGNLNDNGVGLQYFRNCRMVVLLHYCGVFLFVSFFFY